MADIVAVAGERRVPHSADRGRRAEAGSSSSTANSVAERHDSFWCVGASPTRSGPASGRHELGGEVSQWFIYTACTVQC